MPKPMGHYKSVLRGKFIALSAQLKKTEKAHIGDLTAHLKALEKRNRLTQEEQKTGNNQTEGRNQHNRNTENNPKNQ